MLCSDEQLVKDTLAKLARRRRPELKPEHYPHGRPLHGATEPESKASSMEEHQQGAEPTAECKAKAPSLKAQPRCSQGKAESKSEVPNVEAEHEGFQLPAWTQVADLVVER